VDPAAIERPDDRLCRVATNGTHVQDGTQRRPSPPHAALAAAQPTIPGERRDARQGGNVSPVQRSECREIREERATDHRPDARDRPEQFCARRASV
jgi:hypothetical protein